MTEREQLSFFYSMDGTKDRRNCQSASPISQGSLERLAACQEDCGRGSHSHSPTLAVFTPPFSSLNSIRRLEHIFLSCSALCKRKVSSAFARALLNSFPHSLTQGISPTPAFIPFSLQLFPARTYITTRWSMSKPQSKQSSETAWNN